jgi:hypothetical protein
MGAAMITRYEITATHSDGRAFLVAYTPRLTRPGLLHAIQVRSEAIVAKLGAAVGDRFDVHLKPRIHATLAGWTIGFTGRTQHEAKMAGELPFIAGRAT